MFDCLIIKGLALGLPLQEGQLELSLGIVESTGRAANQPSEDGQELSLKSNYSLTLLLWKKELGSSFSSSFFFSCLT